MRKHSTLMNRIQNDKLDINPRETQLDSTLNVDTKEYKPKRATTVITKLRISDMAANEHIEPYDQ